MSLHWEPCSDGNQCKMTVMDHSVRKSIHSLFVALSILWYSSSHNLHLTTSWLLVRCASSYPQQRFLHRCMLEPHTASHIQGLIDRLHILPSRHPSHPDGTLIHKLLRHLYVKSPLLCGTLALQGMFILALLHGHSLHHMQHPAAIHRPGLCGSRAVNAEIKV